MVDAQVSGICGGNPVEVRVFSQAPIGIILSCLYLAPRQTLGHNCPKTALKDF